ncbi:spermidine/putrescine ABC transporter substrate-binding protein [Planosporangium thailandense]|uniref:Spermidine/putrescine ABC transporter substrate-binding protein n=1 Tax=Planosporangium thailandense TaxID=765197 RepID=A0ABX0Y2F0_9ACTN|nr:spermidine/putrescine ABC transporter substrate-binding protein [Planosporangium thailandense]NJC71524.1 spermidine/putrescine ABC transporter substrate-binding protein [Planosporangium thailandense]
MRHHQRPPLSPEAAAVLSASGLSRRTLMRGLLAGGAFVAAGGALAACGTAPAKKSQAKACTATDISATDKKLVFSNWPLYIDVDDNDAKKRPSLDEFTAKTGIAVTYQEDINDNTEFFGKIRNQLQACQDIGRDVIVMTDWMAAKLVDLGWLQKIDSTKMPNFTKNLLPTLQHRPWDKDMQYAAPWQSGLTGLAYNGHVTKEIRTVDELLTRPDLKGKVAVLTEMRDTMGLLLQSMGKNPLDFTEADFDAALEKLKKAVSDGQIRKFTGNDYKEDLAKGDLAACFAWSGDIIQLQSKDDQIKFVAPESGLMLWSDNMLVPSTATHKANAEQLMDHYYDPKVAAEVAAYVNYICPVAGAREAMKDISPDLVDNQLIFPDEATLAKTKGFKALSEADSRKYEQKFQTVAGA